MIFFFLPPTLPHALYVSQQSSWARSTEPGGPRELSHTSPSWRTCYFCWWSLSCWMDHWPSQEREMVHRKSGEPSWWSSTQWWLSGKEKRQATSHGRSARSELPQPLLSAFNIVEKSLISRRSAKITEEKVRTQPLEFACSDLPCEIHIGDLSFEIPIMLSFPLQNRINITFPVSRLEFLDAEGGHIGCVNMTLRQYHLVLLAKCQTCKRKILSGSIPLKRQSIGEWLYFKVSHSEQKLQILLYSHQSNGELVALSTGNHNVSFVTVERVPEFGYSKLYPYGPNIPNCNSKLLLILKLVLMVVVSEVILSLVILMLVCSKKELSFVVNIFHITLLIKPLSPTHPLTHNPTSTHPLFNLYLTYLF